MSQNATCRTSPAHSASWYRPARHFSCPNSNFEFQGNHPSTDRMCIQTPSRVDSSIFVDPEVLEKTATEAIWDLTRFLLQGFCDLRVGQSRWIFVQQRLQFFSFDMQLRLLQLQDPASFWSRNCRYRSRNGRSSYCRAGSISRKLNSAYLEGQRMLDFWRPYSPPALVTLESFSMRHLRDEATRRLTLSCTPRGEPGFIKSWA